MQKRNHEIVCQTQTDVLILQTNKWQFNLNMQLSQRFTLQHILNMT